ncbi:hypothetical protein EOL70_15065 [Leucothrix sargassi]|nr:hypothetical protein EOL70_15065 [Leucothrix sargassi]
MNSAIEDIKSILEEVIHNESSFEKDFYDRALVEIINIERRNIYGLKNINSATRRERIEGELDDIFDEYMEILEDDIEEN